MAEDDIKTSLLPSLEHIMEERVIRETLRRKGTGTLSEKREIVLQIGDAQELVLLSGEAHCLLGRFAKKKPGSLVVDLIPYNAVEMGVSRVHAQLHLDKDHLFVADLDSTNGSYINGIKLDPHAPTPLYNGDELLLGKLLIRVKFK